jgi:hypothetical protein
VVPPLAPNAPITPCPTDARPPCGRRAAHQLSLILAEQRPLLAEWLAALEAVGRRPPDGAAPELLEAARDEPALRPTITRALGSRGAWLAGLNPAWAFAAAEGAAENADALAARWQTGTRAERMALLGALRASRPAQARALVETTWSTEKADDRAAFLAALGAGLSMADEPFLEAALDDRVKAVRTTAAELLARLPESRFAQRMTARALSLLNYRGGLFARLELSLPEHCDKALQRDVVTLKPPQGTGERAWWLRAIIMATPPAAWCAAWSLDPAAILRLRFDKEWRRMLLGAWAAAALSYRDVTWAEALAEGVAAELDPGLLAELLRVLPPARREPLLIRMLSQTAPPFGQNHPALPALRTGEPWGPELARAVIGALARRFSPLKDNVYLDWHLRAALEEFALSIPPGLAEELIAALPPTLDVTRQWADAAQSFAARLRLRRDMYDALRANA